MEAHGAMGRQSELASPSVPSSRTGGVSSRGRDALERRRRGTLRKCGQGQTAERLVLPCRVSVWTHMEGGGPRRFGRTRMGDRGCPLEGDSECWGQSEPRRMRCRPQGGRECACSRVRPSVGWRTRPRGGQSLCEKQERGGELDIWVGRRKVVY